LENREILKGKNMKIIRTLFFAQVLLVVCLGCTHSSIYGPYYGKIIDKETKEPLAGAAVLVVFYTSQPGPAGSIGRYADALETVTDRNGEFRIPEYRVTSEKYLYLLENYGYFTIFRPGYGCYPMHKDVQPMFVPNGTLPPNQYVTIELPRLKTIQERRESTMCSPSSDIPTKKAIRLLELIRSEEKSLGYNPPELSER
jgi:hypothetical protein